MSLEDWLPEPQKQWLRELTEARAQGDLDRAIRLRREDGERWGTDPDECEAEERGFWERTG